MLTTVLSAVSNVKMNTRLSLLWFNTDTVLQKFWAWSLFKNLIQKRLPSAKDVQSLKQKIKSNRKKFKQNVLTESKNKYPN